MSNKDGDSAVITVLRTTDGAKDEVSYACYAMQCN